eukprot:GHUV01023657.1.p1 GENE.GHUV01023657.1~~GHUV01023657.1.p1  ORF type:complete len:127 (-),score=29.77 GHUV01023657.1:585-965(-)
MLLSLSMCQQMLSCWTPVVVQQYMGGCCCATHTAFMHASRRHHFMCVQAPFYRLVAIDSRDRRDGRPIEYLGWYDPLKKETNLNAPAIKKWLQVGAQPSDTVRNLLKKAYVIQPDAVKVEVPRVEL